MISSFKRFFDDLSSKKIGISNKHLNSIINDYNFYVLYPNLNIDIGQIGNIIDNIKKSNIIIIKHYKEENKNIPISYFLISFQNTLIVINQNLLSNFHCILQCNQNLTICFLPNTKKYFDQMIQIEYNEIFYDYVFENEIDEFNLNFCIKRSSINKTWNIICSCISGYLIKKSYLKLNKNRIKAFFSNQKEPPSTMTLKDDEYIKLRHISSGSIFSVDLIYHIKRGELFAMKIPFKNDKEYSKLYNRELNHYSKLSFPFLPNFYGTIQSKMHDEIKEYLVIEYINGYTLSDIKKIQLNDNEKITIIFELMVTLFFIHQNHHIYRDLKPDNIIIDENKTAVLIDFDRMIDFDDNSRSIDSSLFFASPEIQSDKLSSSCDVYSFGKMIYYIIEESLQNSNSQAKIKNFPDLYDIYIRCTDEYQESRPSFSDLIIEYYTIYHSKIKINHFFNLFESYFIDGYNKNLLLNLQNIHYYVPNELCYFAFFYFEGIYVKRDPYKAIHLLQHASNNNDSNAQFLLGIVYFEGCHVEQNFSKAIYYFKLASNQNHSNAQFCLGLIYCDGIGVKKDINKGIHYYTLAANQNNSDAQINLGIIYSNGIYIKSDINKSLHYFHLAAKSNDINAQFNLGYTYLKMGKFDYALYYLTKVANQNDPQANYLLGYIYAFGKGIKTDIKKAIYYLELAANQNDPMAQYNLGLLYDNRMDAKKAVYYYKLAANQNIPEAQLNLGVMYLNGEYIKQDINKAIHYITLASNNYDPLAQFKLGVLYYTGIYLKKDINKAIHLLIKAAENGEIKSDFVVAYIFHEGKNVKKDIQKAIYYYKRASSFNYQYAKNNLGIIYKYMGEIGFSIVYFEEAIRQKNDLLSKYNLAHIYIYNGMIKDGIDKSIALLIKAFNNTNNYTLNILLCLALIKKIGFNINIEKIDKEIKLYLSNSYKLANKIFQIIQNHHLNNKLVFDEYYLRYKEYDFLYNFSLFPILFKEFEQNGNYESAEKYCITSDFYEGFNLESD